MNNLYHYNLNLPVEFQTTFDDPSDSFHTSFSGELINDQFRNWLAERDLQIGLSQHGHSMGRCERFMVDPKTRSSIPIHVDNPDSPNHVKLNYVFCDTPHTTVWYKLKPEKKLNFSKTSIGTNFAWAVEEDCDRVFSTTISKPCLFNATVLHAVLPVTSRRTTFSMTLVRISDSTLITWADAETIFKDYIC